MNLDLIQKLTKEQLKMDLMENKIIKTKTIWYSYVSLIGLLILLTINVISSFYIEETSYVRRVKYIIGYFVFIPLLLLITYFSIKVLLDYRSNKFKQPMKYFLMTLPFLIYLTALILIFIYGVFIH